MLRYLTFVVVPETAATEITAKPTSQKKAKISNKNARRVNPCVLIVSGICQSTSGYVTFKARLTSPVHTYM